MEPAALVGGAKFQQAFLSWTKQSSQLFTTLFGLLLVVWATFAEKLPALWRWQLSTTVGRLLLLLALYITHIVTESRACTLLLTIAIALTWANRPIYNPSASSASSSQEGQEGFAGGVKITEVQGNRWFVEKTLRENPSVIVEDRVSTAAVQDATQPMPGRVSR
jgi:hypothetical protein